eukprot:m.357052 g.357052  ORF g.357052 m.357052 type:complete len:695 (-) comp28021_c0_seq8:2931-5015(-)
MGHRAGVDPSCVRRCAAARRGNYAWLWGVGLLLLSGGTSGNDLVKSVREHLEAAVGRVVGAQDPALEMGFDPCGTHGKLVSRTMCACNFSCAGSMCTKGSGPRGLVTGYDIFKCADCTCRPQRQPDEFSEIECPAGAPPPEVALVVVCCKSAPAQDGEIEVLTPEEAAAGDAWYSLAANKVAICHTVVVRTLGYHTEPIESSILHFLAERYDTMPQMVFFARAANTWLDQIDKHRLLGELSAIPQITAAAPYLPFPAPLITLDEHALSDLRLWWTSNITASANGPPFPEIDPGGKISCCSQFGLFGQAAKQHPRELYVLLRNWAIVHPHKSSKILELVWPLLFRRTLVGAVRAASMWRSARVRAFCKPWKCTCQGFSERFGSRPGTIGDVTEEEEHWWDHGIWDEWAHYIVDATDHSKNHAWALESPSDRENHGTGKCMTSPKHLGIRVLPAKRAAVGEALPKQAIPRIVWQTHYTNKIPPAGQYMFDMRSRNPEYEFRLVGDAEADTFMKTFPLKRVAQAYFSINPACGAARADIWRYSPVSSTLACPEFDTHLPNLSPIIQSSAHLKPIESHLWPNCASQSPLPKYGAVLMHQLCACVQIRHAVDPWRDLHRHRRDVQATSRYYPAGRHGDFVVRREVAPKILLVGPRNRPVGSHVRPKAPFSQAGDDGGGSKSPRPEQARERNCKHASTRA